MTNMKKSAFILLLTASLMLSGCGGDETVLNESTETAVEVETSSAITEWSADDFRTISCCGIDISLPCRLADIDERFEVKLCEAVEEYTTSRDWYELYFENEYVGAMCYSKDDYNTETDSLVFLQLYKFDFYGLNEKSTKEDVQKALGKGNGGDSDIVDRYDGENYSIAFTYDKDDLTNVGVYFNQ